MNWLTSDFDNNVPAFRLLKAADVKHLGSSSSTQLRQMKSFMRVVEGLAHGVSAWPSTFTSATVNNLWGVVAPLLFEKYGKENKLNHFTKGWKSFYHQMSKKGAFTKKHG